MSTDVVYLLLPEVILVLFATAIYLGGAFSPAREGWSWLAMAGLALAGAALYQQRNHEIVFAALGEDGLGAITGPIIVDLFGQSLRWLALGVGAVMVLLCSRKTPPGPEFLGSLVLIIAGLMIISTASELVLIFLGLELVSIPTYVVLYLGRNDRDSQEAATKYFFLSILSSALLLYGFSFLYGLAGSTELAAIYRKLYDGVAAGTPPGTLALLAMVLVLAGLGFRITAVPFHFYAPDVYQGTSHSNAGLLAVVPKVAGLAALVRLVAVGMPGLERIGWQLAIALAILTMTVGNLVALWQNNLRRLLAYSSIAHAGYMLIGLAVGLAAAGGATTAANFDGVGAMLFYLVVYFFATAGAFAALAYLSGDTKQIEGVDELAGVSRTNPRTAFALAVFMFSLTGLPPLAGFWGKLALFAGALGVDPATTAQEVDPWSRLQPWFIALAIAGAINAAISAAYYLRVIAVMYFRPLIATPPSQGGLGPAAATFVCVVLVICAGLNPGPILEHANRASRSARDTFARSAPRESSIETAGSESSRGKPPTPAGG